MVCQAASQTRFRALKHENGIPGRTTIVVRVIACFQPLQNCQAEYFRHLLKPVTIFKIICCWTVYEYYAGFSFSWMVTVEESQAGQQFSAWNFQDFNQMALLHLEQNCSLPYFPSVPTANHPEQPNHLFGCNTGQPNTSRNQCLKNYQHGLGVSDKPNAAPCAHKKRFLIFDRSGNQTRLFVSPSFSRQNNIISSEVPATASGLWKKVACGVDQQSLVRLVAEEKWDENSLNDGEGDMVEDTEDINALLHSDSDDEYDDDDTNDGKNYELTGTRHTLLGIEDCGNKDKLLEQSLEEVASSDSSPKRQKLLDGSCKKSSLASVERPVKRAPQSSNYKDDDVESHDINLSKNSDMVKIHKAVKILGSIIPGLNSKNPVSIIDKAVAYLETMKMEAKAVGYATLP